MKSAEDFFYEYVIKLEDLVNEIIVYTGAEVNGKTKFIIRPGSKICDTDVFIGTPYYFFGQCYSFTTPKCLVEAGIFEILIETIMDADLFIHHQGAFSSPNARFVHVSIHDQDAVVDS